MFLVSFAEFQKSYILYLYYFDQGLSFIRSSRSQIFCRKGALRNLTKFTEKHLCRLPLSVPVLQNICERLLLFHVQSAWVILQQGFSYSEFFWSVFSHIRTEYGEIRTLFTQCFRCEFFSEVGFLQFVKFAFSFLVSLRFGHSSNPPMFTKICNPY